MDLVTDLVPIQRTIDDHIDAFETIGVLLKERNNDTC
jgi:hypothetical protein